jgi:hypothetical protein
MYAASHLWHYLLVYKAFLQTSWATHLWMIVVILSSTYNVLQIMELARMYFRNNIRKAQLIGFVMVTNLAKSSTHMDLFNDDMISFYATLSILMLAKDRPLLSVLALSLGIVKAGIILLIPTVVGLIHYFYGTFMLLLSIVVLFISQAVLAAPFSFD